MMPDLSELKNRVHIEPAGLGAEERQTSAEGSAAGRNLADWSANVELLHAAQALVHMVEGPGCLRWVAGPYRFKDRNEWARFYVAVRAIDRSLAHASRSDVTASEGEVSPGTNS